MGLLVVRTLLILNSLIKVVFHGKCRFSGKETLVAMHYFRNIRVLKAKMNEASQVFSESQFTELVTIMVYPSVGQPA